MEYKEEFPYSFYSDVTTNQLANHKKQPELIFTNSYRNISELISLYAYGFITTAPLQSYYFNSSNYYCIIYTLSGNSTLKIHNRQYTIEADSFTFLNLEDNPCFTTLHIPWQYKILFINNGCVPYLYSKFSEISAPYYIRLPHSDFQKKFDNLWYQLENPAKSSHMIISKQIVDFLTDITIKKINCNSSFLPIPGYLVVIKNLMDEEFTASYSLDELEKLTNINKFRICREFHYHFGLPPIQYLNNVRIEKAKELLLEEDYRVNEICRKVGFDNCNHFIRLFKLKTNMTPTSYKKEMLP